MALNRIPDKLSFFLHHASRALLQCSKDDEYVINFRYWHELRDDPLRSGCHVSLVGAFLAVEYDLPLNVDVIYHNNKFNLHIDEQERKKLLMLNTISIGYFEHIFDVQALFPGHYNKIMACANNMKLLSLYLKTSYNPNYLLKEYLADLNTIAEVMHIYDDKS